MSLQDLEKDYCFPTIISHKDYFPQQHWDWASELFVGIDKEKIRIIVELGSFAGCGTTQFFYNFFNKPKIISVDVWNWPPEKSKNYTNQSYIFESFLKNVENIKENVIPLKMNVQTGLKKIKEYGIEPDLIFHDASHHHPEVLEDLELIRSTFPKSIIAGHDYGDKWTGKMSIDIFVEKYKIELKTKGTIWLLGPEKR